MSYFYYRITFPITLAELIYTWNEVVNIEKNFFILQTNYNNIFTICAIIILTPYLKIKFSFRNTFYYQIHILSINSVRVIGSGNL